MSRISNSVIVVLLLVLVACSHTAASSCPSTIKTWESETALPLIEGDGFRGVILPADAAAAILCPCSRATPGLGESYFEPSIEQIRQIEAVLPAFLHRKEPDKLKQLSSYGRQYLGVVRKTNRFIYVNLFPTDIYKNYKHLPNLSWRSSAVVFCDGGDSFFGVEYDLEMGRFHHIAFNGVA